MDVTRGNEKVRATWAKRAPSYEKSMSFVERRFFGTDHRAWACSRAEGSTLEVAVGTGLNIPLYPEKVRLTAIDLSPEMLELARAKAREVRPEAEILQGDAHELPFEDERFETVVCTYSLCGIPDPARAIAEMKRVLVPAGRLILVDHIASPVRPVYWIQRAIEFVTIRLEGEHMTRRQLPLVEAAGFTITERDRLGAGGVVERLVALKGA